MNDSQSNPSSQIPLVADSQAIDDFFAEADTTVDVDCDCDCVEEC